MPHFSTLFLVIIVVFQTPFTFSDPTDIETYGRLPKIRAVSISPNGQHIAYIQRTDNLDYFVVSLSDFSKVLVKVKADKLKARSTSFATNNHVLFRASQTRRTTGYHGRQEQSGALVYNIKKHNVKLLLNRAENIHPAQTGVGHIVGLHAKKETVYMPAFDQFGSHPYNLYRVNLNTGSGKIYAKGTAHTTDWFVGNNGLILAREEYDEKNKTHSIASKISGNWKTVYTLETSIPSISVQAISVDEKSLIFIDENNDREAVYSMSLEDGEITGPIFSRPDADIEFIDTDINRRLTAVIYSGFKPSYDFSDKRSNLLHDRLSAIFPMSSIHFLSASADKKKVVVKVTGGDAAGAYLLFDTDNAKLLKVATEYDVASIGELKAIKYNARDGLAIPAMITFPPANYGRKKLPLIVLPHGGPESYDKIEFNWLSQYFSAKGYLVLQPNFRGSTGFGYEFRNAGRGRWGQEMQDDVSDGVSALVASGYADDERVCIVGTSYGGYSALAGGAFSPSLYKCIVSINGVADLPLMLDNNRYKYGPNHWVVSYWSKVIGNKNTQAEKLKTISPVNFANSFQSPVLLIHGKDDTVVPIRQSEKMKEALTKAGKQVTFVKLKGEDHWLSKSTSRQLTLKSIDNFLNLHNPIYLPKL